jgi:SAM-dependent methyltransferase
MRRLLILGLPLAAGLVAVSRPDDTIRLIRWLDRRSGIDGSAGARCYAAVIAPTLGELYDRVADDAAASLAGHEAPTIVDLGTGPGALLPRLARRCPTATIIGIDPSAPMRAAAARRLTADESSARVSIIEGTAEAIPLPSASVDLVVSSLASHHWPEPNRAMQELVRVLRPGGRALIYDLRFAGFTERELDGLAATAGIDRHAIERTVLAGRLLRLFALVTVCPGRSRAG